MDDETKHKRNVCRSRGYVGDQELRELGRRLMRVRGYKPPAGVVTMVDDVRLVTDLSSGATEGLLLEQLRELYDEPRLCLVYVEESETSREGWQVHTHPGNPVGGGNSRARALVNAVENWGLGYAHDLADAKWVACVDALNTEPGGYASATGGAR